MNIERFKLERKKRKLTQKQFGEMLGVSEVTISCYEKGTRVPPISKLLIFSKKLKVGVDYLLGQDLNAISERDVSYGVKIAKEDLDILTAIKKVPTLYYRFYREPDRTVKKICSLLEKDNY